MNMLFIFMRMINNAKSAFFIPEHGTMPHSLQIPRFLQNRIFLIFGPFPHDIRSVGMYIGKVYFEKVDGIDRMRINKEYIAAELVE